MATLDFLEELCQGRLVVSKNNLLCKIIECKSKYICIESIHSKQSGRINKKNYGNEIKYITDVLLRKNEYVNIKVNESDSGERAKIVHICDDYISILLSNNYHIIRNHEFENKIIIKYINKTKKDYSSYIIRGRIVKIIVDGKPIWAEVKNVTSNGCRVLGGFGDPDLKFKPIIIKRSQYSQKIKSITDIILDDNQFISIYDRDGKKRKIQIIKCWENCIEFKYIGSKPNRLWCDGVSNSLTKGCHDCVYSSTYGNVFVMDDIDCAENEDNNNLLKSLNMGKKDDEKVIESNEIDYSQLIVVGRIVKIMDGNKEVWARINSVDDEKCDIQGGFGDPDIGYPTKTIDKNNFSNSFLAITDVVIDKNKIIWIYDSKKEERKIKITKKYSNCIEYKYTDTKPDVFWCSIDSVNPEISSEFDDYFYTKYFKDRIVLRNIKANSKDSNIDYGYTSLIVLGRIVKILYKGQQTWARIQSLNEDGSGCVVLGGFGFAKGTYQPVSIKKNEYANKFISITDVVLKNGENVNIYDRNCNAHEIKITKYYHNCIEFEYSKVKPNELWYEYDKSKWIPTIDDDCDDYFKWHNYDKRLILNNMLDNDVPSNMLVPHKNTKYIVVGRIVKILQNGKIIWGRVSRANEYDCTIVSNFGATNGDTIEIQNSQYDSINITNVILKTGEKICIKDKNNYKKCVEIINWSPDMIDFDYVKDKPYWFNRWYRNDKSSLQYKTNCDDYFGFNKYQERIIFGPLGTKTTIYERSQRDNILGFENLGNTCYFNTALQSLINIKELRNYIAEDNNNLSKKDGIFKAFNELICDEYSTYRAPKSVIKFASKIDKRIGDGTQYDAWIAIDAMLKCLDQDMTGKKNSKNTMIQCLLNVDDQKKITDWDKFNKEVCNDIWNEFSKTKIRDMFYGISVEIKQCLKCKWKQFTYDVFNMIKLPQKNELITVSIYVNIPTLLQMYKIPFTVPISMKLQGLKQLIHLTLLKEYNINNIKSIDLFYVDFDACSFINFDDENGNDCTLFRKVVSCYFNALIVLDNDTCIYLPCFNIIDSNININAPICMFIPTKLVKGDNKQTNGVILGKCIQKCVQSLAKSKTNKQINITILYKTTIINTTSKSNIYINTDEPVYVLFGKNELKSKKPKLTIQDWKKIAGFKSNNNKNLVKYLKNLISYLQDCVKTVNTNLQAGIIIGNTDSNILNSVQFLDEYERLINKLVTYKQICVHNKKKIAEMVIKQWNHIKSQCKNDNSLNVKCIYNIDDSLKYYQKNATYYTSVHDIDSHGDECKGDHYSLYCIKTGILQEPKSLMMCIDRGSTSIKNTQQLIYPVDTSLKLVKDSNSNYMLTSVCVHEGDYSNWGHYFAYIYNFNTKKWVLADDSQVSNINYNDVNTNNASFLIYCKSNE